MCPINSHILAFDLPTNPEVESVVEKDYLNVCDRSREEEEVSSDKSLIQLETKEETSYKSPFRKKGQNCVGSEV